MGEAAFNRLHETVEEIVLDLPSDVVLRLGRVCVDREGKKYSLWQNIGIGIQTLVKWLFNKDIPNYFSDGDKTTNCLEEIVVIFCEEFSLEVPKGVESWYPWEAREWFVKVLLPHLKLKD
jgi:hypothetical protein